MRVAVLALMLAGVISGGLGVGAGAETRPPKKPDAGAEMPAATTGAPKVRPEAPQAKAPESGTDEKPKAPASLPGPPEWEALRETEADFTACTKALWQLGADFTVEPPFTDPENRNCGIARPIRVETILPKVEIAGGAVMRCDTALALGRWLRDFVRPAGRLMPDRPELRGVLPGSTYQCRDRVGTATAKTSEHALGNAFDVAGFRFEMMRDGKAETLDLPVEPRQNSGDMAEALQRAARGAACLYFTTVLGPGSNDAHDDHLHLDIRARNGGFRLCQ